MRTGGDDSILITRVMHQVHRDRGADRRRQDCAGDASRQPSRCNDRAGRNGESVPRPTSMPDGPEPHSGTALLSPEPSSSADIAAPGEPFAQATVSDYLFDRDKVFAYLNLDDNELFIYQRFYDLLSKDVSTPDLVVYLQAPTDVLLRRQRERPKRRSKMRFPNRRPTTSAS